MVFCSLTNLLVSRRGDAVQKHLGGKRFARAQGEFCRRPESLLPLFSLARAPPDDYIRNR